MLACVGERIEYAGPQLNTTPLIGVMLVLLTMLMLTLLAMTHSVRLDLARRAGGPRSAASRIGRHRV